VNLSNERKYLKLVKSPLLLLERRAWSDHYNSYCWRVW